MNTGSRFNVRAFFDLPACCNLFFACIADEQDFQLENDLSATQRVVSINSDGFPVLARDQKSLRFTPVVLHQDGRNGILLGTVTGESVADPVRRMLTAPEVRSAIGAHNRREAWARYEAGVVSGQMLAAYQELT